MPEISAIFAMSNKLSVPGLLNQHQDFLVFTIVSHFVQFAILPVITNPLLNRFEQSCLANLQSKNKPFI